MDIYLLYANAISVLMIQIKNKASTFYFCYEMAVNLFIGRVVFYSLLLHQQCRGLSLFAMRHL